MAHGSYYRKRSRSRVSSVDFLMAFLLAALISAAANLALTVIGNFVMASLVLSTGDERAYTMNAPLPLLMVVTWLVSGLLFVVLLRLLLAYAKTRARHR
jgi:multisubunit Na+/H+ antiporter MnhC subunit